ncbi:hypothetical protein MmiAt1_05400 [Methanimicrococcus sp. At1]|uniref:DUF7847 domain-containing protein n=1 Tax=Methanimicrococcus hacksteinii TaxID=3028293 RepID=A0ABU3VNL1_9EURY|nr:hypothetical protein [Methanimicrococcus sp. At1]MDV0444988.1 hypothetical protein [Methanimicrococcus sp. At1]
MADINFILKKGFDDVKKNPIMALPFIILGLIEFILVTLFGVYFTISFFEKSGIMTSMMENPELYIDPDYILNMFGNIPSGTITMFFVLGLVILVVVVLATAFLRAGLIGMSKEAILSGKTNFSDMMRYGKKYFLKELGLSVLIYLILFIPSILIGIIGGAAAVYASVASTSIIFMLLMILYFVYLIICAFLFYFAEYALIYDDFGIIDSLKRSYHIFTENKSAVVIFVLVMLIVYFVVSLLMWLLGIILAFIPMVGILLYGIIELVVSAFILALVAAWSGRKYIDLKIMDRLEDGVTRPVIVEETIYETYSDGKED